MPTIIRSTKAVESSTFVVTATFHDEDGSAVTPNTLFWTLTDEHGTVINDNDHVEITPVASSSVDIVLSGDDLEVSSENLLRRILTIEATYDSALGDDWPLNDSLTFFVEPLKALPRPPVVP